MFSQALTVQVEYINHLLQFLKNISYYAGIMLNAFGHLLCSKLCWHNRLVPTDHELYKDNENRQLSKKALIGDHSQKPLLVFIKEVRMALWEI